MRVIYENEGKCEECSGKLQVVSDDECECHLCPPCKSCEEAYVYCSTCGFVDK